MNELIELIADSVPAALGFAGTALFLSMLLRLLRRKPVWNLWSVTGCFYLGFLLAGTLRPESIAELFEWRKSTVMNVTYQLSIGDSISSLHGLFNIALFIPWGMLGMITGKKLLTILPCLLSCTLMTFFIETYQLYHMRSFDFGDVLTNIAGCVIGIVIMLPYVIWHKLKNKRYI